LTINIFQKRRFAIELNTRLEQMYESPPPLKLCHCSNWKSLNVSQGAPSGQLLITYRKFPKSVVFYLSNKSSNKTDFRLKIFPFRRIFWTYKWEDWHWAGYWKAPRSSQSRRLVSFAKWSTFRLTYLSIINYYLYVYLITFV